MAEVETTAEQNQLSFNEKVLYVAKQCGHIEKAGTNTFHKYKYIKADDVSAKFLKARLEVGLSVMTRVAEHRVDLLGDSCLVSIVLEMTLTDGRGGLTVQAVGQGKDSGDKAGMKAFTAASKYCVMALCSMSEGADPEADAETDKPKNGTKAKPPADTKKPVAEILEALAAARSLEDLEAHRGAIVALGINSDDYKAATTAFKEKKKEIGN